MTKGSGDARMQPLYFLITTAGTDTNSICYETHQKAVDILEGRKAAAEALCHTGHTIRNVNFLHLPTVIKGVALDAYQLISREFHCLQITAFIKAVTVDIA